ncbi:MAG: hypothetical protein LBV72_10175 [Tannerella sp.]|jgi:hypothetical protein|nr:hypothetical protein [Tannerella sp.]
MSLKVEKTNALKAWRKADTKGRALLEDLYGKDVFEKQDVKDRIKTLEDCFEETGRPITPEFNDVPDDLREYFKSVYNAVIITEALNERQTLDLYNREKPRHYPYFETNGSPAGFAFYDSDCDHDYASAGSGSRLSFISGDLAAYAGKIFKDQFRDLLTK